ncbi:MAG: hypothetical protein ABGZ35_01095, partial [Planctomycetaceae bacterium]
KAGFLTRTALRDAKVMNEMLERRPDYRSESTTRRIHTAGERVVEHLLFADEVKLTDPIVGRSGFAEQFADRGPRDQQGRSLRVLDLNQRLFRYPCSYVIYSNQFDSLPDVVREYIYRRLWEVLTGKDTTAEFAHLSAGDRGQILEILRNTKPGLPEYWNTQVNLGK